jgi:catechol 2,3-dioxygenase-like lactoylglutathione lyase family enzyme
MQAITGIIETALYVDDLGRAVNFYQSLFGFSSLAGDARFHSFSVADRQVLLLFLRGSSVNPVPVPGGFIPPHDGSGTTHVGFSITRESLPDWEKKLVAQGVPIESRFTWAAGGISLYFRDPDGHLLELLTPGVWRIY